MGPSQKTLHPPWYPKLVTGLASRYFSQWRSFIENTKLTISYSLESFTKLYIGCNLWFSRFTPLEDEIYPQG